MKRIIAALAVITLAAAMLAACGTETAEVTMPPASAPAQESAPPEAASETGRTIAECIALLGKTDAESADALGGGEENIAADGETPIGRVYSATMFGEEVEPSTMYDASGKVAAVSIYLSKPDGSAYQAELESIYGEPADSSDEIGESGSTWVSWYVDGVSLRLIQGYGLCSLEISAIAEG